MNPAEREAVLSQVRNFVESSFDGRYEIYDLSIKHANSRFVLEVIIDQETGIRIEDCAMVSRGLSKFLDETDPIHRNYDLEVASPGAERLLKRDVDYRRHLGRLVRWVLKSDGPSSKEIFKARLQEFSEDRIVVQTDDGLRDFSLTQVEQAQAILEFPAALKRGRQGR